MAAISGAPKCYTQSKRQVRVQGGNVEVDSSRRDNRRRISSCPSTPPIGFMSCIFIVSAAAIIVLRFFWPAMVVAFALLGVTSPSAVLGVIVGIVILSAACMRS